MKSVIFDLDGTLALIDKRRAISMDADGKMDWNTFFNPSMIELDEPNAPVIEMAKMLKAAGHMIVILSGRSKATKEATREWLNEFGVPFDVLKMRPTSNEFKFKPDDKLKQDWLDQLFTDKSDILCVFDDRQKVVDMWRANGLTCMQVAPGNF
jgi:phosphoglycolate phosphatase-like HAD superfamily hydrolase